MPYLYQALEKLTIGRVEASHTNTGLDSRPTMFPILPPSLKSEEEKAGGSDNEVFYGTLKIYGVCSTCCLRYLGGRGSAFDDTHSSLKMLGITVEPDTETEKPCVACLGVIQTPYCDAAFDKMLQDCQLEYDSKTFVLAINLPVSWQLRTHSLQLALNQTLPDISNSLYLLNGPAASVKDVWKWMYTKRLEENIYKKFDLQSSLTLTVNFTYEDEVNECTCLYKLNTQMFNKKTCADGSFSRKSVELALKSVTEKAMAKHYQVPPQVPRIAAEYSSFLPRHNSVNVAGRYCKYSRELPQTPWVIQGERKMDNSIQELISEPIELLFKAKSSKFSSSGREDVDVRTLGSGRPFNVELIDPCRTELALEDFRNLEKTIRRNSKSMVVVRDLQIVSKESLHQLKLGEEEKTKEYKAVCVVLNGAEVSRDMLGRLETLEQFVIQQSTPVRVLHRRPVSIRPKTINWLKASPIEGTNKFVLTINTQAGTYIKEFVHGDFGRTNPSLGEMLGGVTVDILALDVQDISLDWPPPVNYAQTTDDHKLPIKSLT